MEIFPSVDLRDGKVVRLTYGDFDKMDVYPVDPVEAAIGFREAGAKNLHVVDLDGAKSGEPVNFPVIRELIRQSGLYVEVGGGIRSQERMECYLSLGAGRVILGTVAAEDFAFTERMIAHYGDKVAVGVDALDGKVAVRGWIGKTKLDSLEFCQALDNAGVSCIIYTDISKDGAMAGTNLDIYRILTERLSCKIVASGGISSIEELSALKKMGVNGAILGKALYNGLLDLKEVICAC